MRRCPISYEPLNPGEKYSINGLKRLSRRLIHFNDFPYSAQEQVREASQHATKMSIQGVQPKLSTILNIKHAGFEIVNQNGHYILKPQNPMFAQLPENEDVTMRMAKAAGIEVPVHGLIYSEDNSLTYFIKRFDRSGKKNKIPLEDFSQLTDNTRETKYGSSMEKVAAVIEEYCTFPMIEKVNLFRLTLFNFLVGNEDMHLKNFSLITRKGQVELSPAYDLLNTTIVLDAAPNEIEEIALPIAGKKRKLSRKLFVEYYAKQRLELTEKSIVNVIHQLKQAIPQWQKLIDISFLSSPMKEKYLALLITRKKVIE